MREYQEEPKCIVYTPDALKHTVAGELVHDERGLHVAGLLVGVRHKATHKVGVAAVQGLNRRISYAGF